MITHNSFIPTVAGMSRGSLRDRCQLLTHVFTCWHLGHLLPEFSHLAREGQSVTIPYVTKERVRHVVLALQQVRRLVVLQDSKRPQEPSTFGSDVEHHGEGEDLFSLGVRKVLSNEDLPDRATLHRDVSSDLVTYDEEAVPCLRNVPSDFFVEFDENGDVQRLLANCDTSQINNRQVFLFDDSEVHGAAKLMAEIDRALEELFPSNVAAKGPSTPNSCASVEVSMCEADRCSDLF